MSKGVTTRYLLESKKVLKEESGGDSSTRGSSGEARFLRRSANWKKAKDSANCPPDGMPKTLSSAGFAGKRVRGFVRKWKVIILSSRGLALPLSKTERGFTMKARPTRWLGKSTRKRTGRCRSRETQRMSASSLASNRCTMLVRDEYVSYRGG